MKVNNIQNSNSHPPTTFSGLPTEKITQFFLKHENVGEATSIAIDILGKAVLVPLVIMFNPFSKKSQSKEDKKYSAIKNPIAALIQLGLEVPIFYYTSNGIRNLANKGLLDNLKKSPNFSYNAKAAKNTFITSLDKMLILSPPEADRLTDITRLKQTLSKARPPQKTIRELNQFISSSGSNLKGQTKTALDNLNNVNKRLFHLESRFSFIAAILAVPLLCAIENWLHPKIMKLIDKRKQNKTPLDVNTLIGAARKARTA